MIKWYKLSIGVTFFFLVLTSMLADPVHSYCVKQGKDNICTIGCFDSKFVLQTGDVFQIDITENCIDAIILELRLTQTTSFSCAYGTDTADRLCSEYAENSFTFNYLETQFWKKYDGDLCVSTYHYCYQDRFDIRNVQHVKYCRAPSIDVTSGREIPTIHDIVVQDDREARPYGYLRRQDGNIYALDSNHQINQNGKIIILSSWPEYKTLIDSIEVPTLAHSNEFLKQLVYESYNFPTHLDHQGQVSWPFNPIDFLDIQLGCSVSFRASAPIAHKDCCSDNIFGELFYDPDGLQAWVKTNDYCQWSDSTTFFGTEFSSYHIDEIPMLGEGCEVDFCSTESPDSNSLLGCVDLKLTHQHPQYLDVEEHESRELELVDDFYSWYWFFSLWFKASYFIIGVIYVVYPVTCKKCRQKKLQIRNSASQDFNFPSRPTPAPGSVRRKLNRSQIVPNTDQDMNPLTKTTSRLIAGKMPQFNLDTQVNSIPSQPDQAQEPTDPITKLDKELQSYENTYWNSSNNKKVMLSKFRKLQKLFGAQIVKDAFKERNWEVPSSIDLTKLGQGDLEKKIFVVKKE